MGIDSAKHDLPDKGLSGEKYSMTGLAWRRLVKNIDLSKKLENMPRKYIVILIVTYELRGRIRNSSID